MNVNKSMGSLGPPPLKPIERESSGAKSSQTSEREKGFANVHGLGRRENEKEEEEEEKRSIPPRFAREDFIWRKREIENEDRGRGGWRHEEDGIERLIESENFEQRFARRRKSRMKKRVWQTEEERPNCSLKIRQVPFESE